MSIQNPVRIVLDQVDPNDKVSECQTPFDSPPSTKYSVGAVLAGPSSNTSMFAAGLGIEAQKIEEVKGICAWQALENGTGLCDDCASAGISVVPAETQRISVIVVLRAGAMKGLLYLTQLTL